MERVNSLLGGWRHITTFFLTSALVVFADQFSKYWIRSNLAVGESLSGVGFFRITHIQNTGAAFGLSQGQSAIIAVFVSISIVILLFFVLFMHRRFPFLATTSGRITLGLILGGAVGNLIDRLNLGYVTDFIDFSFWPAFNIADSSVVVGAIIFAYLLIRLSIDSEQPDKQST